MVAYHAGYQGKLLVKRNISYMRITYLDCNFKSRRTGNSANRFLQGSAWFEQILLSFFSIQKIPPERRYRFNQ